MDLFALLFTEALLYRRTDDGKYGAVSLTKDHSPTQVNTNQKILFKMLH